MTLTDNYIKNAQSITKWTKVYKTNHENDRLFNF